ncbi:MAG: hypothetical protein LH617_06380, partial [Ramlibacter sp.]|nr:hypothetical protein [Ramlibacter sp.]
MALIGRPLDLAISVTLDNAAQASELCAEADVFHGDSQVDRSRVTVRVDPVGGVDALLRVRSTQAVDEPVVTVYLRLGCNQKSTRRYVLLAEEPGELPLLAPSVPAPTVSVPRPPSTSVAVPRPGAAVPSAGSATSTGLEQGGRAERAQRRRDARNAEAAARAARRAEAAAEVPVMRPRGAPAARTERSLGQSQQQQQRQASGRS